MVPKYSKPKTSTNGTPAVSLSPVPVTATPTTTSEEDTSAKAEDTRPHLKQMNVTDAMAYIQNIREHRDPSVYDNFLKIMTEFKSQR